jgi:subtilisin-like proprotein convertase family protein
MYRKRRGLPSLGVLALALSVAVGLTVGVADAKKKTKAGGLVDITMPVNQQIPDATGVAPNITSGTLTSTITVGGKKFKGTKVRDVNVTLQTTGSTTNSAGQLDARLTAPDGASLWLFGNNSGPISGQSIGPLTLDDETPVNLGGLPPAPDSTTLVAPYVGTAQPNCFSAQGVCTLSALDNGPVTGVWTLRVSDSTLGAPPATSILNSWRLTAVAGKAFLTK